MSDDIFFLNKFDTERRNFLRRTELFAFARELRARSNNKLFLSAASIDSDVEKGRMVTEHGIPAMHIEIKYPNSRKDREYNLEAIHTAGFDYGTNSLAKSKQKAYVMRRIATVREPLRSFHVAIKQGEDTWFYNVIQRLVSRYMGRLLEQHRVESRFTPNFHNSTQEWLLRVLGGYSHRADFPTSVENEVATKLAEYENRNNFLKQVHALTGVMFDRAEKWLVGRIPDGYVVAAFDPRALVRYISEAAIEGNTYLDINHSHIPFTVKPQPYLSLDDVPSDIRDDMMSALHLQRVMRESAHPEITGIDSDNIFAKTSAFYMSNEGGWMTYGYQHRPLQWIIADKG
jgi:hypothetical protein